MSMTAARYFDTIDSLFDTLRPALRPLVGGTGEMCRVSPAGIAFVKDTAEANYFEMDAPGCKAEDVTVSFEDGRLSITAVRNPGTPEKLEYMGDLRVIGCVAEGAASKVADGVISVTLPRRKKTNIPTA